VVIRARLIVVAALAFLFAQIQCVAMCASLADNHRAQDHPCCPHHSGSPHSTAQGACAHLSPAAHAPQMMHIAVPLSGALHSPEAIVTASSIVSFQAAASPPNAAPPVLRI